MDRLNDRCDRMSHRTGLWPQASTAPMHSECSTPRRDHGLVQVHVYVGIGVDASGSGMTQEDSGGSNGALATASRKQNDWPAHCDRRLIMIIISGAAQAECSSRSAPVYNLARFPREQSPSDLVILLPVSLFITVTSLIWQ